MLFAVPGAFTPACQIKHLPPYVEKYKEFRDKGVDIVGVVAANDAYVLPLPVLGLAFHLSPSAYGRFCPFNLSTSDGPNSLWITANTFLVTGLVSLDKSKRCRRQNPRPQ